MSSLSPLGRGREEYVAGSLEFPNSEQESLLKHEGGGPCAGLWACAEWRGRLTRVVASTVTPCLISTSATGAWPSCATRWRGVSPLWKEKEVHHLVASKELQGTIGEHCPGVWLSGLGIIVQTERLLVQFLVGVHAWVVGWAPGWGADQPSDFGQGSSSCEPAYPYLQHEVVRRNQRSATFSVQGQIATTLGLCLWHLPNCASHSEKAAMANTETTSMWPHSNKTLYTQTSSGPDLANRSSFADL